jgi:hypothetical protein
MSRDAVPPERCYPALCAHLSVGVGDGIVEHSAEDAACAAELQQCQGVFARRSPLNKRPGGAMMDYLAVRHLMLRWVAAKRYTESLISMWSRYYNRPGNSRAEREDEWPRSEFSPINVGDLQHVRHEAPRRRLWLIAFSEGTGRQWWKPLLKPGYRHVCAASYFADMERWLYIDPTYRGLEIEMWKPEDFGARLEQMARDSTLILRVPSATDRNMPPLSWFCVGAVKALLGLPTVAVTPWQLSRQLLGMGAETVCDGPTTVAETPASAETY